MSPRFPYTRASHAPRARGRRAPLLATAVACAACIAIATAATPLAGAASFGDIAASQERLASQAWNPFFASERPVPVVDARHVIVVFEDPSLGEWNSAGQRDLSPAQRRAWVKRALALQQKRLDAIALGGVQFRVEHRYVRVLNGASIVVHGDGAQLLRGMSAVAQVVPVRPLWPAAVATPGAPDGADLDDGAAGAAAAAGVAAVPAVDRRTRVAVLDTGIDQFHPAVSGHVATAVDVTRRDDDRSAPATVADPHGTAVGGAVLRGAGDAARGVELLPVQVLTKRPARDGVETVIGESDDLLAGLEHVVDPDGDGDTADAVGVALVASTTPYAGFAGSPEDRAVRGADALGTLVVAASGNDGASGDDVGTVGSVAASDAALTVGAADLRGRTPATDLRVRGDGIDDTFADAPILTAGTAELPSGKLAVAVVEGGGEVVDYLDAELRSRVAGAVALVAAREGTTIAEQVRAAADAGAIAVIVGSDRSAAAAGTIDVPGADIPAVGISRDRARDLRGALAAGTRISIDFGDATTERNPAHGTVAGFSSSGPRLDGVGRPDVLAPGVGMLVAGPAGAWRTESGTSIAAAWAAGQAASLRSARPDWDPSTVRAALIGTAFPLGTVGDRPSVSVQGAGVLDADRAAAGSWLAGTGRIDFGSIRAGEEARRPLDLGALAGSAGSAAGFEDARILLDDGGRELDVTPSLDDDQLVLSVAGDARDGHVGGWLVLPGRDIRIPWTATIRDAADAAVAMEASVSSDTLAAVAGPGAYASTLSLAIGGERGADGSLGLAAVQRLEIRLVDSSGKDHGAIGGLDQALPGIYTFGVTGVDAAGTRLAAGRWTLQVRYVPAADPAGEWREGASIDVVVEAAARAKPAK